MAVGYLTVSWLFILISSFSARFLSCFFSLQERERRRHGGIEGAFLVSLAPKAWESLGGVGVAYAPERDGLLFLS